MKTTFFSFFIMCLVCQTGLAHKEPTHQYIIQQAYRLLLRELGITEQTGITDMKDYIGDLNNLGEGSGTTFGLIPFGGATTPGTILAGAWEEDWQDPVYKKDRMGCICKAIMVSAMHFWDADKGSTDEVGPFSNPNICGPPVINAFQKIWTYFDPEHAYDPAHGAGPVVPFYVEYLSPDVTGYRFTYHNLIDFYKNGNIKLEGSTSWTTFESAMHITPTHLQYRKKVVYAILGRMAHLIGDMSVPVHAHEEAHGCNDFGLGCFVLDGLFAPFTNNCDAFEQDMSMIGNPNNPLVRYWDYSRVLFEKGGMVYPLCTGSSKTSLFYLMYTTNQIADHFATNKRDGNNNLPFAEGFENDYELVRSLATAQGYTNKTDWLSNTQWYGQGAPPQSFWTNRRNAVENVRNTTFPYAIRATAGLLYFFAREAGLLQCTNRYYTSDQLGTLGTSAAVTLNGNSYHFSASEFIIAGKSVQPSSHTFTIESGTHVDMKAGEYVQLTDGFHAVSGSVVHVYIDPCEDGCLISGDKTQSFFPEKTAIKQSLSGNEGKENQSLRLLPNPAMNSVKVDYIIMEAGQVTITVKDMFGRLVKLVVDKDNQPAGRFVADTDVSNVPSGTYYITLKAGKTLTTQRIIIAR